METLSILTATQGYCSKGFRQQGNDLIQVDRPMPYLFDHVAVEVDSISTLASHLKRLESLPSSQVIRGLLISGRSSQSIRRTLRANTGEEPNFEHSSRQWCLIDIDDLPLPEHLSDYQTNKIEIVDFAVSHLPKQFHNVQCWYQFSSSMGIKKDKIRELGPEFWTT